MIQRYIVLWMLFFGTVYGVDLAMTQAPEVNTTSVLQENTHQKVFGSNLFLGKFATIKQYRYNPDYRINIGDNISSKFWGAYNMEIKTVVDNQGNIFIPKVGVIHLLGVRAGDLNTKINKAVRRVFKSNVYVYSNVINYQPITVFVTGSLKKPGLYEGLSSDSVLQFIDKAQGIRLEDGSFRFITIKRDGKTLKHIDLYEFLTGGKLDLFQFKNGDVIYVDSLRYYVHVEGDVKRAYRFELKTPKTTLQQIAELAVVSEGVTDAMVYHWGSDGVLQTNKVSITQKNYPIYSGDKVVFLSDHNANAVKITLEGEVEGPHTIVMPKGSTLADLLDKISFSSMANKDAIQLYRKSIAQLQKQLIDSQLKDLRARVLTASSITTGGAAIRKEEAELILRFIQRAQEVEPKGRVRLNEGSDLSSVLLEDEDTIYIPKKSSIVTIQGEVKIPGAQTFVKGVTLDEYIKSVGGLTQRADEEHILLIKPSGAVYSYDASSMFGSAPEVSEGDAILVLGKPNSENLQISKDITQIIYQIAVSTGVVMTLF